MLQAVAFSIGGACFQPSTATGESVGGFRDISASSGLNHVQRQEVGDTSPKLISGGGAVGDFFGNGRNDLFLTRHDNTDLFYMNRGDGTFENRTQEVFGGNPPGLHTNGALLADLTNNGYLDLYVTTNGGGRHYLYINDGGGMLSEEGIERGAVLDARRSILYGMSVTAGDYTGNGYLDLFVSDWSAGESRNRLLRNRGSEAPGYFEDVTEAAGLGGPHSRWGFGARFADMNRNGRLDLIPYNDFAGDFYHGRNQFFWNSGNGTFRNAVDETGTTVGTHEMGITVADLNNNGWLDIFLTDIARNILYRNDIHLGRRGFYFTELGSTAGVNVKPAWGWGTSSIDHDNNGLRDLVSVNGWMAQEEAHFFRNNGEPELSFTRLTDRVGLHGKRLGRGVIVADFTGNGWQDILIINHAARPELFENLGGDNDWLRINLRGTVSNRQGIGAWITVTPDLAAPEVQYVHEVNLEANFLSHSETTAHFGLGKMAAGTVDHVHIRWPSGVEQDFFDVEINQVHAFVEEVPATSPERERFDAAAAAAGLSGPAAEPKAVPFGDGARNLIKYAFNLDLSGPDRRLLTPGGDETAGLPAVYRKEDEEGAFLVIEFLRRRDSDLVYTPYWSVDLHNWQPIAALPVVTGIDSDWERAVVSLPLHPTDSRCFGKVRVTLP